MSIGQNTISGDKLHAYVERIERLRAQKKDLTAEEKVVIAEAAAEGFLPSGISFCVKVRAKRPQDWQEEEALRDMYLQALGMAETPPLFRAAGLAGVDITARDQVIEAFKKIVPAKGEAIVRIADKRFRIWRDKDGQAHQEEHVEPEPAPRQDNAQAARRPPPAPVPDVDADGAETVGRDYARDNRPVIDNPFPFGDTRRARFDAGWRRETGSDGMGPDDG